jgi:hypothetical protein
LYDSQLAEPQRRSLRDEAAGVAGDPTEPQPMACHPHKQSRAGSRREAVHACLLLQHGSEREQERGDQGEEDLHCHQSG